MNISSDQLLADASVLTEDRRDLLLICGISLFLLRFLTGEVLFGILGLAAFAGYAALRSDILVALCLKHRWVAMAAVAMLLVAAINGPEYHWRTLYYLAVGCCVIFACFAMAASAEFATAVARWLLFAFIAVVLAYMPFKGVHPEAFNHYFPNTSRNGIGAILIFAQIFYSAACYMHRGRAPLVTPVATFLLCVFLYGRSGTLVSYILVVASCLAAVRSQKLLAVAAFVVSTAVMAIVLSPMVTNSMQSTPEVVTQEMPAPEAELSLPSEKPNPGVSEWRRGLKSIRPTMIKEYLLSLQPMDWLLGGSLAASPTIAEYNLNPHNSFIRGHAYFGAAYLLLIGGILLHALYEGAQQREWFLPTLMLIFATRAFFDISGLFDLFDFGFFFTYFALQHRQWV